MKRNQLTKLSRVQEQLHVHDMMATARRGAISALVLAVCVTTVATFDRPWRDFVKWPSFCAGRTFEPPSECTYNALPRLARLKIFPPVEDSSEQTVEWDSFKELLNHRKSGHWPLKPPGCFAFQNGALHFNHNNESIGRAVTETNICSKCSDTQQDVFELVHGGVCRDVEGLCPISNPEICARAAIEFGIQGHTHDYSHDNVTVVLIVMAGSRVGSTWCVSLP